MQVLVELEDLETLVFATATIKQIEAQLQARKADPFVQPHLHYAGAVDRMVGVMNQAKRSQNETKIGWDDPLTAEEEKLLKSYFQYGSMTAASPNTRLKTPAIDTLACKGMVILGQAVSGFIWADNPRPDIKPDTHFGIKITPRGRTILSKLLDGEQK